MLYFVSRSNSITYLVIASLLPGACSVTWLLSPHNKRSGFEHFPRTTLWAWERPENLRALDPSRFAVAYLDKTIFVGASVVVRPRLQPLLLPAEAKVISVVRIEAPSATSRLDFPNLNKMSEAIVESARRPGVSALQIDFDATRSQRESYRQLLAEVRRSMPPEMPLSITALGSWCFRSGWLTDLPVDEAVPMFFRMGRDANASRQPGWKYPIQEPLCAASAGVSTDEPWPQIDPEQRIYIFHSRAWDPLALKHVAKLVNQ